MPRKRCRSDEISANASKTLSIRYIGAGIAFSAIGSVGIGIGILFNGLLQSMALNPVLMSRLFSYGLLGFALVESAILFALLGGMFVMFV